MGSEIDKDIFEGLYLAARGQAGDWLKAELKTAGYDVDNPLPRYPVATFQRVVSSIAARFFPGVEATEAERRVGVLTVEGFSETFTGKVLGMTLPLLGPRGLLRCYPKYARLGGTGFVAEVEEKGPGHWTLELIGETPLDGFMRGVLEQGLRGCGVEPVITQLDRTKARLLFDVRWTE